MVNLLETKEFDIVKQLDNPGGHSTETQTPLGFEGSGASPPPSKDVVQSSGIGVATDTLVNAALWYADKCGYYIFPVNPDKKPHIAGWPTEASTDESRIRAWWGEWTNACIGVACGPSSLLFLDLDTYADGGSDAAERIKRYLQLPEPTFTTGRGGEQYIFRCYDEEIRNSAGALSLYGVVLRHVDVRANGGFSIVPPSVTRYGPYSRIAAGDRFTNPPLVPDLLERLIRESTAHGIDEAIIPEGQRHTKLASIAGSLRAKGLEADSLRDELLAKNESLCQPPLDDSEVAAIADYVASKPTCSKPIVISSGFDPVVSASSVTMRNLEWLYKPFIPKGKLTVLAGQPKDGKSLVAVTIAAALTTGKSLPGEASVTRKPMHVIYMTAEDAFDDTLKPRFMAATADLDRVGFVHFVTAANSGGSDGPETILLSNQDLIRRMLTKHQPGLLVVDPLHCFLGVDVDFYKASETRPVLAGLASLAEEFACSMLLIEHLNKSDKKGASRILGSVDIGAACRSILMTARSPLDQSDRFLCLESATSQVDKVAVSFKTEGCSVTESDGTLIETVRLRWGGIEKVTFDEIMATQPNESKTKQAEAMLRELLPPGVTVPVKDLESRASSRWTLKKARANLEAQGYVFRTTKDGLLGGWAWAMDPPTERRAS